MEVNNSVINFVDNYGNKIGKGGNNNGIYSKNKTGNNYQLDKKGTNMGYGGGMGKGFGGGTTSSVLTEDYVLCNMCNRKYNELAYNKHMPTCERRTKEALIKTKLKSGSNVNSTYNSKPNLNVKFGKR